MEKINLVTPRNHNQNNYGIYDYFNETNKKHIKTFGTINDETYIFKTHIFDHYCTSVELEKNYGKYSFWFSAWQASKNKLNITCIENKEQYNLNLFQLECILGMLFECKKYYIDKNETIEVEVPAICFKDKKEKYTSDIDSLIDEVTEYYNQLKKEEEKNKGIKNLRIFKLFNKEKNKRK